MNRDKVILTGFAIVFSALILFGLLYDFNFYTFTDETLRPITAITFDTAGFDGVEKVLPITGGIFCILTLIFLIAAAIMCIMRIFIGADKSMQVASVLLFVVSLIFAIPTALFLIVQPLVLQNIDPGEMFEYVDIGKFVVCAVYAGIIFILIVAMMVIFQLKTNNK